MPATLTYSSPSQPFPNNLPQAANTVNRPFRAQPIANLHPPPAIPPPVALRPVALRSLSPCRPVALSPWPSVILSNPTVILSAAKNPPLWRQWRQDPSLSLRVTKGSFPNLYSRPKQPHCHSERSEESPPMAPRPFAFAQGDKREFPKSHFAPRAFQFLRQLSESGFSGL